MSSPATSIHILIDRQDAGYRVDKVLAHHKDIGCLSRSQIKKLHTDGYVLINNAVVPLKYKVQAGDVVDITIPPPADLEVEPEAIPLDILFEDEHIIVINKQAGIVVHPSPGHDHATLVHGLLYHCDDLSGIGGVLRPGIVHRLDKDTSGVLIAAKTDLAHHHLVRQFKDRLVKKTYLALLAGCPDYVSGTVSTMIGRHPIHRKKMAVVERNGRLAVSHWQLVECFADHSFVRIHIETGRTHQIRVHMAHIGCPVLGDTVYGGKKAKRDGVLRQCLHASTLTITHPVTLKSMRFKAPLAEDINLALQGLQNVAEYDILREQICVTGAIGSGKSRVAKALAADLGLPFIDVDDIARDLMAEGGAGLAAIGALYPIYIREDGSLDRLALREAIFNNPDIKTTIDSNVHPLIQRELLARLKSLLQRAVIEIPLVYETGWDALFDTIILVTAPQEVCVQRVADRDKVSVAEALKAYECQMDEQKKRAKAKFIIHNEDWPETEKAIEQVADNLYEY